MTDLHYPRDLPCPTARFNQGSNSTFLRTEFDYHIRHRSLPTSVYTTSLRFVLKSNEQMKLFKDFYFDTLNRGVYPFQADWVIEGDTSVKWFRFKDIYKVSSNTAGIYEVTADFELLDSIGDL